MAAQPVTGDWQEVNGYAHYDIQSSQQLIDVSDLIVIISQTTELRLREVEPSA